MSLEHAECAVDEIPEDRCGSVTFGQRLPIQLRESMSHLMDQLWSSASPSVNGLLGITNQKEISMILSGAVQDFRHKPKEKSILDQRGVLKFVKSEIMDLTIESVLQPVPRLLMCILEGDESVHKVEKV